jgi:Kelch motif protein
MRRPAPLHLALQPVFAVILLGIISCGEETPTQPSSRANASATPTLAATGGRWSPIAPVGCCDNSRSAAGVVPNTTGPSVVYVFGGVNANGHTGTLTRAYDVATNTWSTKTPEVAGLDFNGVGNVGGKLYFTGGYARHDEPAVQLVWQYDPSTDVLTRKADMPLKTAEGVTGVIGDKLYVVPGWCDSDVTQCAQGTIRKLFRYNPATNIWVTKAPPPHYHLGGAGGVINDKFYVVGGGDNHLNPTRNLDVYDPVTNAWKTLAPIPATFRFLTGTPLRGRLYVVGLDNDTLSIKHYAYDPASNTWSAKTAPSTFGTPAVKVFLNGTSRLLMLAGATEADSPDGSQLYTP